MIRDKKKTKDTSFFPAEYGIN